jgi:hypothetical protein
MVVQSKKPLVKKIYQKYPIKTIWSKMTCPEWHFGQVGHGGKKTIWWDFLTKILS